MNKWYYLLGVLGSLAWCAFNGSLMSLVGASVGMVALSLFYLNQHLTIALVQLEVLGLTALSLISYKTLSGGVDLLFLFSLMVVAVIEAALGLSLIVKQARNASDELLKFNFYLEYSM